jgi:hypothetical protein
MMGGGEACLARVRLFSHPGIYQHSLKGRRKRPHFPTSTTPAPTDTEHGILKSRIAFYNTANIKV